MSLPLTRAIQIYGVQLAMGLYFLYIGWKIYSRNKKRLNKILSSFYVSAFLATIVNVIYAPLETETVVHTLNILTFVIFSYGLVYLVIFNMKIKEYDISIANQNILKLVYFIVLMGMFLFYNDVQINPSTDWKPVWGIKFVVYVWIVLGITLVYFLTIGIKILPLFEEALIRKKWKYYLVGVVEYFVALLGTSISNYLNDPVFRSVWLVIGLLLFVSTAYFIYIGLAQQIKR